MESKVLLGFQDWKVRHEERVKRAEEDMLNRGGVIGSWEKDVQRLATVNPLELSW